MNILHTISDLSLVIGAKPDEDFYSRQFFCEENVMVLDRLDTQFPPHFSKDRYLQFDFTNINELKTLISQYKNQFQTICFDWSVWKFFIENQFTVENCIERLNCLYDLLKPAGVLIIPNACLIPMFAFPPDITPFNTSKEEILKLKTEAQDKHTQYILSIFKNSNFANAFNIINSRLVCNNLFQISTNLHVAYQTEESITNGYDVLLAKKFNNKI
jgi:hypothetical protein